MLALFEFLFSQWGKIAWLGARFVPRSEVVQIAGLALTVLGIALAIWARYCLGANWSGAVTLKEGHELIGAGPYKRIRHPIYAGFAIGFAGRAIVIGGWRGVIAFGAISVAHFFKARKEEAWLARVGFPRTALSPLILPRRSSRSESAACAGTFMPAAAEIGAE